MFVESIRTQLSDGDWRTGDVCVVCVVGVAWLRCSSEGPGTALERNFQVLQSVKARWRIGTDSHDTYFYYVAPLL